MNTATTAGMPEYDEAGMTYTIQNTISLSTHSGIISESHITMLLCGRQIRLILIFARRSHSLIPPNPIEQTRRTLIIAIQSPVTVIILALPKAETWSQECPICQCRLTFGAVPTGVVQLPQASCHVRSPGGIGGPVGDGIVLVGAAGECGMGFRWRKIVDIMAETVWRW